MSNKKAVILVSGGLDSATVLALARQQGFELFALSIDYGQRHRFELEASKRVCESLGVTQHRVFQIDLHQFGGSALTDNIDVPKGRSESELSCGIPITYVPSRNAIFLSLALGWAEALSAFDIFIGVNAVDYSGYPDCRPEFIATFEALANLATKAGVEKTGRFRIHTPLISLTKADIIRKGLALGVDYSLTSTCYAPNSETGTSCGQCDSCQLRLRGFAEVGQADPIVYRK